MLAAAGGEAGERQDDLAGQRREQVLEGDGQAGAGRAEPVHQVDGPAGDAVAGGLGFAGKDHVERRYGRRRPPTMRPTTGCTAENLSVPRRSPPG